MEQARFIPFHNLAIRTPNVRRAVGVGLVDGRNFNFTQPVSGHWYFSLKDENAQVRCAMFRMKNMRVGFKAQNGMLVLVRASVSLYEPRGDYQLIIESMNLAGESYCNGNLRH